MGKSFCIVTCVSALLLCGLVINNLNQLPPAYANTNTDQNMQKVSESESAAILYKKNCASCHDREIMGAPKPGDPRFLKDIDLLVTNAIKGIGKMPERGHAVFLSDDEIRSVVEFMASHR